jgi:hypothetical protein
MARPMPEAPPVTSSRCVPGAMSHRRYRGHRRPACSRQPEWGSSEEAARPAPRPQMAAQLREPPQLAEMNAESEKTQFVQRQRGSALKLMGGWKGLDRQVVGSGRRDAAAADPVLEVRVGTVEDGADVEGVGRRAAALGENVPGIAGVCSR